MLDARRDELPEMAWSSRSAPKPAAEKAPTASAPPVGFRPARPSSPRRDDGDSEWRPERRLVGVQASDLLRSNRKYRVKPDRGVRVCHAAMLPDTYRKQRK